MNRHLTDPVSRLLPVLASAGAALALWAAWLGWDQHRDVRPDGTSTGPYEPWQVIGLVLTLLAPVCWAAYRGHRAGAVVGTTTGLGVAAFHDWSGDGDGLFVIGVGLVVLGSLAATAAVSSVARAVAARDRGDSVSPGSGSASCRRGSAPRRR
ncbi:hypothetical protein ACFV5G_01190 [Streptomyces sp. NPDC059766]|uniref:hypothetical protein n=1 Tax=Streptomyces sp. NPDC059766 TaxID=3346940 RepID=UPI003648DAE2